MKIYIIVCSSKTTGLYGRSDPETITATKKELVLNKAIELIRDPESKLYSITELEYYNAYSDRFPSMRRLYLVIEDGNFELKYHQEVEQAEEGGS